MQIEVWSTFLQALKMGFWDSPGFFNYVPSPLEAADVTDTCKIFPTAHRGMKQRALFFCCCFFKLLAAREWISNVFVLAWTVSQYFFMQIDLLVTYCFCTSFSDRKELKLWSSLIFKWQTPRWGTNRGFQSKDKAPWEAKGVGDQLRV